MLSGDAFVVAWRADAPDSNNKPYQLQRFVLLMAP
jgi:hypothetical protein